MFNCESLSDGTERFIPAPHLNCYDDKWTATRIYATLTLAVWGVLFPIGLAVLLSYFRSRLRTAEFSRQFSLLTFGYKRECTWWEVSSMLKKFLVSGCIVLFRQHPLLQGVIPLGIILVYVSLSIAVRPFYNSLLSAALVLSEVRSAHRSSALHHDQHEFEIVDARDCLQITCFMVLASGVPFLSAFQGTVPKYWGFYILPWVAAILLPLFLLFSIGLAVFELYYEFTTTSGKGRPFRRLLASLRVPGERRTAADVRTIHKAFAETEFLQRYPVSMLLRLCRMCELLELKPDEAVFREGEVGHHFYVLIHGTVDVSVADVSDKSSPRRLKCLNSLHDSGSFGERALTEVRCSFTATTADRVAAMAMGANWACRTQIWHAGSLGLFLLRWKAVESVLLPSYAELRAD